MWFIFRTCKVQCKGCGVLSPMALSASHIIFPTTRLGSTSRGSFTLTNSKLSRLSSARIRGTAPAQGTRAFSFSLPPEAPFTLSPQVGVLKLGEVSQNTDSNIIRLKFCLFQSVQIKTSFSPKVTDKMIQDKHEQTSAKVKKVEVSAHVEEAEETTNTITTTLGKAAMGSAKKANPRSSKGPKVGGKMLSVDIPPMGQKSSMSPYQSPTSSMRKMSLIAGSSAMQRRKHSPGSASSTESRPPTLG